MCGLLAFSAGVLGSPSGRASNVTPGQYLAHLPLWLAVYGHGVLGSGTSNRDQAV